MNMTTGELSKYPKPNTLDSIPTLAFSRSHLELITCHIFIKLSTFFFTPSTLVLLGAFHVLNRDRPVVEKLSRSRGVGPQTLGTQCGIYFGADEKVRGVVNVCLAEWA